MAKVIAVHDKVIMRAYEDNDKMVGGFIIPDTGKERSNMYEVTEVGPGLYNTMRGGSRIPMSVNVGDLVFVPKAVVYEIQADGVTYYMTRDPEIQAIYQQ